LRSTFSANHKFVQSAPTFLRASSHGSKSLPSDGRFSFLVLFVSSITRNKKAEVAQHNASGTNKRYFTEFLSHLKPWSWCTGFFCQYFRSRFASFLEIGVTAPCLGLWKFVVFILPPSSLKWPMSV